MQRQVWPQTVWILCVALTVGCSMSPRAGDALGPLEPSDFAIASDQSPQTEPQQKGQPPAVALTEPQPAAEPPPSTIDSGQQPQSEPTTHRGPAAQPALGKQFTIDAMVGQVNGQPIYAAVVFEPIDDQLAVLGRTLPRQEFRQRAQQLIASRLGQMVADALILGEAEGDLSAQEQAGLQNILKQQREELIRFWGRGSVALAEDSLVRQTSRNLEQTVSDTRERLLVQRFLRQRLWSKVNVTRKDVARYYNDHTDRYNPPPTRTLRLIFVDDPQHADRIDQLLEERTPFAEVASLAINRYRPDRQGLMSEQAKGDQVFGQPQLNAAMLKLQPGEHSQRVAVGDRRWWIYVQSIEQGQARPLSEVQLEIEQLLTRQQFQLLSQQYRASLFASGSYNQIDLMTESLLEIALSRFAMLP